MWEAMRRARPGLALGGEDPLVRELVALGARLLGKETGLFVPTCSMANLLALVSTAEPGDQVVFESTAHMVWSEGWSLAHPAGVFPRLLDGIRGIPEPAALEEAIGTPRFGRMPRTALVCLENSHNNAGGTVATPEQTASIAETAHRYGAALHLDGARLFNAAASLGVAAERLAALADTVSVSLNKGLSAPEGALLCGPRAVIDRARRWAQRLGAASLHKAGIAAAAGIVALTTMVDRLKEDNRRAARLAATLVGVPGLSVDLATVQTNIVNVELRMPAADALVARAAERHVLALARSARRVRFVTHRMIEDADIDLAAGVVARTAAEGEAAGREAADAER
jgi:threonine aldolase